MPMTALCLMLPVLVHAEEAGTVASEFQQCKQHLKARAEKDGISTALAEKVIDAVQLNKRVLTLDRAQPEFVTTFTDYYKKRVTTRRIEIGRKQLVKQADLLARIKAKHGIPPHYLMAFWGLETNFGSFFGNTSVPASLITLACDPRRSGFFTTELMGALRILEAGDITVDKMEGSWAGAMGHFQFMPSTFLRYAVDGDDDGRRNLWASLDDAMYSAANFLEQLGWQTGFRWGREVVLPQDFDVAMANTGERKNLSYWRTLGIRDVSGSLLPGIELTARLLLPAGHEGPAFVVYDNFDVIMKWNRSESYALAVGRLADRIAGAAPMSIPLPESDLVLTTAMVVQLQKDLKELGYSNDRPDGIPGPNTRAAISQFQRSNGLVADGYLDKEAVEIIRGSVEGAGTDNEI